MFNETIGRELARWAIRLAVFIYVLRVGNELRSGKSNQLILPLWVTGCVCFVIHVFFAFDGFHGWSHAAAVEFTALETQRVVGIRRGEGVWVNYFFTVVWFVDCVRLWRCRRKNIPTYRIADWTIHGFFAVMMISATVVFGPRYYMILLPGVIAFWSICWWSGFRIRGDELD